MPDLIFTHFLWALTMGAISAVSLPLGSLVGLKVRFDQRYIAAFAAFGAGALIAALSVELVAPTCLALTETSHAGNAGHALANFLAMIVGGAVGGILFVRVRCVRSVGRTFFLIAYPVMLAISMGRWRMANDQRVADKERYWRGVVDRHATSKLSVRSFCRRELLSEASFYAWRRTIGERDRASIPASAFLPVVVSGEVSADRGSI